MIRIVKNVICEIFVQVNNILMNIPGATGIYIRKILLGRRFKSLGKNFVSSKGLSISTPENIEIGNDFSVMKYSSLNACRNSQIIIKNNVGLNQNVMVNSVNGGKITIGNNVMIGPNVVIRSANHKKDEKGLFITGSYSKGDISIGDNVWIGANSVILKNVEIGKGATIGAGTTVYSSVEENGLVLANQSQS